MGKGKKQKSFEQRLESDRSSTNSGRWLSPSGAWIIFFVLVGIRLLFQLGAIDSDFPEFYSWSREAYGDEAEKSTLARHEVLYPETHAYQSYRPDYCEYPTHLLIKAGFWLFGFSWFSFRLIPILMTMLVFLGIFSVCLKYRNPETAVLVSFLLFLNPVLYLYSKVMLMFLPSLGFIGLGFWIYTKYEKTFYGPFFAGFLCLTAILAYAQLLIFLASATGAGLILLLFDRSKISISRALYALAGFMAGCITFMLIAFFVWDFSQFTSFYYEFVIEPRTLQVKSLHNIFKDPSLDRLGWLVYGAVGFIALSILKLIRKKEWPDFLNILFSLWFVASAVSLIMSPYTPLRYFLNLLIPGIVLSGFLLVEILRLKQLRPYSRYVLPGFLVVGLLFGTSELRSHMFRPVYKMVALGKKLKQHIPDGSKVMGTALGLNMLLTEDLVLMNNNIFGPVDEIKPDESRTGVFYKPLNFWKEKYGIQYFLLEPRMINQMKKSDPEVIRKLTLLEKVEIKRLTVYLVSLENI